jgi:hypothetical protein
LHQIGALARSMSSVTELSNPRLSTLPSVIKGRLLT